MKKLLLAAAATLLAASLAHADTANLSPKRELRGVWISTHLSLDWPNRTQTPDQQRAALAAILDHNLATGMNAAFLQVRSQSDALYPSELEPWSYYLTNNQGSAPAPSWDPLQFAIAESRKRGLEFHAWINPYRAVANTATETNTAQYAANHVSRTHPEWMLTVGTVKILNPGLAAVREHVTKVIMDIVERYDVDGIHFDDYFYPAGTINDDAAYAADPRGFPATAAGRADWRRDNINLLIAGVGERIRAVKPWVKFGVSPSGIYRSSTDPALGSPTSSGASQHFVTNFADTRSWLREGWVDYLAPQVYWYMGQAGSDYKLLVPWWNENAYGRHMYIGIADYKMGTAGWLDAKQVANQIALNRAQTHIAGQIHFRHAFLQANPLGYRTDLQQNVYKRPALVPAMPWKGSVAPLAPSALAATQGESALVLSWTGSDARDELEKVRQFAVYRSAERTIDIEAPQNLIGVTHDASNAFADTKVEAGKYYYYTVTALNRLSRESAPSNVVSNDFEAPTVRTRDVSVTLANGAASLQPADIDGGTGDNWGIESLSASQTSFSCGDIGVRKVVLSAIDKAGLSASGEATVTVIGRVPQPAIAASVNAITLGYGAQSVVLTASDAGAGTGFAWVPAAGLAVNGATATFTPTAAGSYTFTVQAFSENGCPAVASVTVPVIDARCGDGKVAVCHKPGQGSAGTICVAPGAVQAFIAKGETPGACQ
ncbi:family 10 glycosylhydrolase [Massilia litorea]|uniref:Family 10 glycosylhydrolase n=1 Tax=Massilia litorea TaxID=2769491 RepID=A0A7L9U5D1_9BURK|nr:family 10 glycosylhydrolase [Massilia litorea]QOL49355.1 family 10 glycosylhydrolase [Massilia litorea]